MRGSAARVLLIGGILTGAQCAGAVEVLIVRPVAGQPVFGQVEIEVAPVPKDALASKIEFYVDGRLAGVVDKLPYQLIVDVGESAAEHHFEVVWFDVSGPRTSASLRTPMVNADEVVNVELRQVFVRVERDGRATNDLKREDFELYEDGQRQEIIAFEHGDVPFTAALLLDASTSMGQDLATATAGAKGFLSAISPLDEAKLLLFSSRLLFETPFTNIPAILTLGLAGVRPEGGTALNDALFVAVERLRERRGRRVVILLSDGVDIESVLPMARVRLEVAAAGALLYWLRLPGEGGDLKPPMHRSSTWRNGREHEREISALLRSVRDSGGRVVVLAKLEEAPAELALIARELREQYMLGYSPRAAETVGRLAVKVRQAGLKARIEGRSVADD